MSKKYFEAKNTEEAKANEVPEKTKEEQKMEVSTTMTLGQKVGNAVGKGIDTVGNGISKVTHSKGFKAVAIIGAALAVGMTIANRNGDDDHYDEDDSDNDIYVDSIDVTDGDTSDDDCNSSDDYATEETEA